MAAKKNRPGTSSKQSFTSLRIIGEQAQKLLAKAKQLNTSDEPQAKTLPPEHECGEETAVYFSVSNVVYCTLAVAAVFLGIMLLYLLRDKIVLLLLAMFIATIMDPGVESLKRMGIPRGLGVILHYLVFISLILFLLISFIPIIAEQIQEIAVLIQVRVNGFLADPYIDLPFLTVAANAQLTGFLKAGLESLQITEFADAMRQFGQGLGTAAQGSLAFAAKIAGSVFGFLSQAIVVLVLAFFMQVEKTKVVGWIRGFLAPHYRLYANDKVEVIHFKLAQWARGQLILCCSIGLLVFLAMTILGMPYALTLALLAGFTEFIPVIGPLIAAMPSVLIAITGHGFLWGVVVALVYYVIQWCENNLLVPLIMKRAVGLSPIAILFAMLVAISFPDVINPILGVMLAIPTTTIIALFLEDLREMRGRRRMS